MELNQHFRDFLENIRPTPKQRSEAKSAHETLRQRLSEDGKLDEHVITTFLQGSYRRSTDIRPVGDKKSDVDIVVVTNMDEDKFSPALALAQFKPFLEKYYKGAYRQQDRSWGVEDGDVELDLVPTSAPSEVVRESYRSLKTAASALEVGIADFSTLREAMDKNSMRRVTGAIAKGDGWKDEPLHIPDRATMVWTPTNPLAQIRATVKKNNESNGYFVDVVRCLKWWHLYHAGDVHPHGYPLEAIVFECCTDNINSVAKGIVVSMEAILLNYKKGRTDGKAPTVDDHGVPGINVLKRLNDAEFIAFYDLVARWAPTARNAYQSIDRVECFRLWRDLFGDDFPSDDSGGGGDRSFPRPTAPAAAVPEKRYAIE